MFSNFFSIIKLGIFIFLLSIFTVIVFVLEFVPKIKLDFKFILKPISLRCVYELSQQIRIPIIGCGGVENWRDVIEYLMAGASAVQIGTAISYQGVEIFRKIADGLNKYLSNEGINDVNDIIGIAHRT